MPCPQDGWIPPIGRTIDVTFEEIPSVPGLLIERPIGAGGSATVWRGRRRDDGVLVALKVGRGDNTITSERFRRDAEAIERVGPPFAPRLYDHGRLTDRRPYIVMELLLGRTLATRLEELPAPLDFAQIAEIGDAVLEALGAAHAKGVIHRDLKPENIVFGEDSGRATLIDFGLTRSADGMDQAGITRRGMVVGTPEYMAPEQIRGDPVQDTRADIYSFGVILFELMTLRLPFVGERSAIEHGHLALRPPRPREFAGVPVALEKLTLACLAKEPERRPPDAASLRLALAWACPPAPVADRPDTAVMSAPVPIPKSSQLLTDGRQPAVVMVVDAGSRAAAVVSEVTAHKGFVARQKAGRLVCVFSGLFIDDPVLSAITAARELAGGLASALTASKSGTTVSSALHLAALTVRRKEHGPPAVYGVAVEQPASWMPHGPFHGVVLTAEIARAVPSIDVARVEADDSLQGPAGATFFRLRAPSARLTLSARPVPLLGRDSVIAAISTSIEASMAGSGGSPGLFTLIGDHGLGKSRLADEAATLVRCIRQDALLITIRSSQPVAGDIGHTTRELLARVLHVRAGDPPSDPRRFCCEKLGAEIGEEVWPAVAATLGWGLEDGAHASPWSVRSGAMRALAEGLRMRARARPVAVILDDAHWTDEVALDALELATLDAGDGPLWVLVAAHPRFEDMRRSFGSRAHRHDRVALAQLDEASMMRLAAELLLPAEYTPAEALRQIAAWAGHNPYCLTELVRALKRAGIVRKRASGSFYVATAELDHLPPLPAWQWLAGRRLDALPPELSACVRLCAVLGVDFSREEVERIQDAIEQSGGAGTPIDAGVGLAALVDAGLLARSGSGWFAFQSAPFRDAVYDSLAPEHRRKIHRHAFAWWASEVRSSTEREERSLVHLARHASACGARGAAVRAHMELGDMAREAYQYVEADQRYTAALSFLEGGEGGGAVGGAAGGAQESDDGVENDPPSASPEEHSVRRASALLGRAKVRYRVHRIPEALDDLRAARTIARELGDGRLLADVLLAEATVLDWANDFAASASSAQEARSIISTLGDPALENRCLMAEGRSSWRQQRVPEAIELLARAADGAEASGDHETRVMALPLLASALVLAGRLIEAEARFEEVIALCIEVKDRLHLCSAYANRAFLWTAQSSPERGMEDLRRAVQIAREVGNPEPEHVATHNLAELLHWSGQGQAALALARRSRVLTARFGERQDPSDALLVARILAAQGEFKEAAALIDWIAENCPPSSSSPTLNALFRMLRLALAAHGVASFAGIEGPNNDAWDDLQKHAEADLPVEELLEVLYWRARSAIRAERWAEAERVCERAEAPLGECSMWRPRFAELKGRLPPTPIPPVAA